MQFKKSFGLVMSILCLCAFNSFADKQSSPFETMFKSIIPKDIKIGFDEEDEKDNKHATEQSEWEEYVPEGGSEWDDFNPEDAEDWEQYVPQGAKKYIPQASKKDAPKGASSQTEYHGPTTIEHTTKNKLNVYGPVKTKALVVKGPTNIYGPLTALGSHFHQNAKIHGPLRANGTTFHYTLTVTGPVHLEKSRVKNKTSIYGPLNAINSTLENVFINSDKIWITNSVLKSLYIRKDHKFFNTEKVYLKGKTIIKDPIEFESGKGEVYIEGPNVKIGQVIGGKIFRKKSP
jgi:hypothetical protein